MLDSSPSQTREEERRDMAMASGGDDDDDDVEGDWTHQAEMFMYLTT